jgi:cytochrome c5
MAQGEQVYNGLCAACHGAGVAGAPRVGDAAAWGPLAAKGLDALTASAISGKGAMPPRGGNPAFTDAQIRSAVAVMLAKSK